jgi:hypothetical protein
MFMDSYARPHLEPFGDGRPPLGEPRVEAGKLRHSRRDR